MWFKYFCQFYRLYIFIFIRKEINREKELAHIEQDLKDELEEVVNEKEEELRMETSLYNQKLKAHKFQQTRKV
jgi:hypothetical protein